MNGKVISPPLPVPIGFKLLPSLLPGQQLTPCLYVELNGLPIYLIISPSLEPHLSFLSLILALEPHQFASPLSLAVWYNPNPDTFSTLNGLAPWMDIWIPLPLARAIVRDIRGERLFWDEKGSGLLGDVDHAVSWEENGVWSHNWLPSPRQVPSSSYSFDNLILRKWDSIRIIPDQCCAQTPADKQRPASIISDGQFNDPSKIRSGPWDPVWTALMKWTRRSYTEHAAGPSKLSGRSKATANRDEPISNLILSITALFGSSASTPAPPISSSDIEQLFPLIDGISTYTLITQIISIFWDILLRIVPGSNILRRLTQRSYDEQSEARKLTARINLALCALCWDMVIGIWHLKWENARLRRAVEGGEDLPAEIVISAIGKASHKANTSQASTKGKRRSPTKSDELARLERKRGGSPPIRNEESSLSSSSSFEAVRPRSSKIRPGPSRQSRTGQTTHIPLGSQVHVGNNHRSLTNPPPASPGSGSEEWFDIRQRDAQDPNGMPFRQDPHSGLASPPSRSSGHKEPRRYLGVEGGQAGFDPSKDAQTSQSAKASRKRKEKRFLAPASDGWLDGESSEEEVPFMHRPEVVAATQTVLAPVILIMLVVLIFTWWNWDPPEPSVIVL